MDKKLNVGKIIQIKKLVCNHSGQSDLSATLELTHYISEFLNFDEHEINCIGLGYLPSQTLYIGSNNICNNICNNNIVIGFSANVMQNIFGNIKHTNIAIGSCNVINSYNAVSNIKIGYEAIIDRNNTTRQLL